MRGANLEEPLAEENWEQLLKQTVLFAADQVHRLRWRGASGGLLPEGYDPNSLAAEALAQLFFLAPEDDRGHTHATVANAPRNTQHEPRTTSDEPVDCGLWPVDRGLWTAKTLHRLVRQQINRLHHRKERSLLRNAEDFAPVLTEDGELLGLLEALPSPEANPLEALLQKESAAKLDQFKQQFTDFLAKERRLKGLFECLCAGTWQRKALAARLRLGSRAIQTLQERLRRRLAHFLAGNLTAFQFLQSLGPNSHPTRKNQNPGRKNSKIFR